MNITGGKYNSISIKIADYGNIKPTLSKIRQAVFNSLNTMGEFKTFCDLFAGSGIMSFEAISRNFDVTTIEIDRKSAKFIKQNAEKLKININLITYDAIKFLNKTDLKFDIFYLDPPYQAELYNPALKIIKEKNLLNENGLIILERPIDIEIDTTDFLVFKQKTYSDKSIDYLKIKT